MKGDQIMKNGFNSLKEKAASLKKHKGVDGIIVVLFLCVIAVVLCAVFKNQISTFMTGVMNQLTDKAKSIIDTTSVTLP